MNGLPQQRKSSSTSIFDVNGGFGRSLRVIWGARLGATKPRREVTPYAANSQALFGGDVL